MIVLIADDEPLARRRLRRLLSPHDDVVVVEECPDGFSFVEAVARHEPDVAFLDVRMPGLDGFEALARLEPDRCPEIVFVTAFDQYAVRAFEVEAVDYLVKPVDAERLGAALSRVSRRVERGGSGSTSLRGLANAIQSTRRDLRAGLSRIGHGGARHLLLKEGSDANLVAVDDIDWIEADGNYVSVHAGDRCHLVRRTLSGLEDVLDPTQFARIHRSTIVNLDRVERLTPGYAGSYFVFLRDGTELTLSRGYRADLLGRLGTSL